MPGSYLTYNWGSFCYSWVDFKHQLSYDEFRTNTGTNNNTILSLTSQHEHGERNKRLCDEITSLYSTSSSSSSSSSHSPHICFLCQTCTDSHKLLQIFNTDRLWIWWTQGVNYPFHALTYVPQTFNPSIKLFWQAISKYTSYHCVLQSCKTSMKPTTMDHNSSSCFT